MKEGDRIVHRRYGAGVLQHIHPGAPGKLPAFGHARFDADKEACGRRVLLRDLLPEPALPLAPRHRRHAAAAPPQ